MTRTAKQVNLNNAYNAKSVIEWRAKGFKEWEIRRMLLETVEHISFMLVSDIDTIMDIADGRRCA